MSLRRQSRSRSRSRDKKSVPSKLRMDSKPATPRITDPSVPASRRREIDNVMKKARAQTSPTSASIWDKKLLEVEAKDPNRWRHSGYKSLYVDGRSPSRSRSRSRSYTRARSPPAPRARSPRSPPPRSARSPRSPPARARSPPPRARSPPARPRSPPPRRRSPRSPPPPRRSALARCGARSASASSVSSCSDDSCSMCSPKRRRARTRSRSPPPPPSSAGRRRAVAAAAGRAPPSPKRARGGGRPPSPASPPPRRVARPRTPPGGPPPPAPPSDRPTDPRRRPPPPPPRASSGKVIDVKGVRPNAKPGAVAGKAKPPLLTRIKKEGVPKKKRPGSPGADSSGSEDSSNSIVVPIVATTGLTLSERFGKIAQWSADRERRDIENMRITKTGSNMKVMVEEDDFLYGSPPRRYSLSPVPAGHYPDELLSSAQSRLAAWEDIQVRYQYYKDLGYLRDLSLEDYVKWEEWWYKYQDWLASERDYERRLETQSSSGSSSRRRRRKRSSSSRLN